MPERELTLADVASRLSISADVLKNLCRCRAIEYIAGGRSEPYLFDERAFSALKEQFPNGQPPDLTNKRDSVSSVISRAYRKNGGFEGPDFVYFIQAIDGGPIKIGKAALPRTRLRTLQTAHHQELRLIGYVRGGGAVEQIILREFAAIRIRGEWFKPTRRLLRFINDLLDKYRVTEGSDG